MTTKTDRISVGSFDTPDETRSLGSVARFDIVKLGQNTTARATMQPGFHWTEHARPIVGTDLCQVHHVGYVVSGRARVRLEDGTEREVYAGDVFDVPPGHDMWVVGDDAYVAVEFEQVS